MYAPNRRDGTERDCVAVDAAPPTAGARRWMEEFGALSRASVEATSYDVRTARHTAVVPACLFHGASYHDERWLVRSIPYFESTGMPDWSFMDYELAGVDFP